MKEAVSIQGDSGSRIVLLNTEYCNTPSLPDSEDSQVISTNDIPDTKGELNRAEFLLCVKLYVGVTHSLISSLDRKRENSIKKS